MTAGSSDVEKFLDPAVKPRDVGVVGEEKKCQQTLVYHDALFRIQRDWEASQRPPLLSLSAADRAAISACLAQWQIPRDTWYVCLHVREPGYPIHLTTDSTFPSTRDAHIADYSLAIEAIVQAGGWVFRMGDPSMTPLPPMMHVVDYAHSPFRSEEVDILLTAGCRFVVGTASGYLGFPMIYHRPCLVTNVATIGWPLWPTKDLMLPKLFREKATGRYLTLTQIFEQGLACLHYKQDVPSHLELVDNTPQDLQEGVKEMLRYTDDPAQCGVTVGASEAVQQHYHQVAVRYGGYTGNRLAGSFVKAHAEVFAVT